MSVFLRWGIFGILGAAALLYAFNASKRMAERHAVRESAAAAAPAPLRAVDAPTLTTRAPDSPACEAELAIATRALDARAKGEPLDRLLRIQEIAFEEQPRRARLEKVATDWYSLEGPAPVPEGLHVAVLSDCREVSPAP